MKKNLTYTIFTYMVLVLIVSFVLMGIFWTSHTKDIVELSRELEVDYERGNKEVDLKARVESITQRLEHEEIHLKMDTENLLKERVQGAIDQMNHLYTVYETLLPELLVEDIILQSITAQKYQFNQGNFILYNKQGDLILNGLEGLELNNDISEGIYFKTVTKDQNTFEAMIFVSYFATYDYYVGSYINYNELVKTLKTQLLDYLVEITDNYDGNVSFFVHDYKGIILSDAYYSQKVGENNYDFKNSDGQYPIQEQIVLISGVQDSGFHEISLYDDKEWLTFVQKFESFDWVVGGRTDLSNWHEIVNKQDEIMNEQIDDQVKQIFIFIGIVSIIALIVAYLLTKHLKKGIKSTLEVVKNSAIELTTIELERVAYKDLKDIVQATNNMTSEINHLKHYDPLTGLFNKNYLMELLENEHLKSIEHQTPLSLILIDIDEFRNINERYGFEAGDTVLKTVAALIVSMLREEDKVARYNGEEFLILLPDTTIETAVEVAGRIRQSITTKMIDPIKERVTLSSGIVSGENELVRKMIRNVEESLYKAKKKGMNSIHY